MRQSAADDVYFLFPIFHTPDTTGKLFENWLQIVTIKRTQDSFWIPRHHLVNPKKYQSDRSTVPSHRVIDLPPDRPATRWRPIIIASC